MKLLCEAGTGYNNVDLEACRRKGITVMNVPAYSSDAVATLVSGSISGAVADAITHPISTVKTRLQVQGAAAAMGEGGVAKMALYRGPVHATSAIIKSEGVFALYTGLGAVLAAAAPGQALYFGGYEALKGALPQHPLSSFAN